MLSLLVLCGMMPSFAFAEGGSSNETDEPLNINWVCTYPDGTSVPSFGGFNLKPIFPDMEDITGGGVPGTIFDVYVNITKIKSNATVDENGEYTIPLNGLKLKDGDRINFVIPKPDAPDAEPRQQKLFTITVKPVDQNWNQLAEEQFQDMDISGQQGYVNHTKVRPNDNTNVSEFMLGLMQMKGYLNILPNEGQELIGVYNQDKSQLELTDDNDLIYVSGGYKSYKIENLLKGEPRDIVLYAMVKKDKDIDSPAQEENFTYSDNTKTTITGLTDAGKKMLKDNGGKLVIPKGVREIGYRAFDKTKITSVDIPDSVTSIGKEAFAHNNLTTVNIPNSVTEMGDGAFAVNKLESVHISEQLAQIKNNVFDDNQITSVIIPNSVISIGEMAFSQNKLTSVNIPKSVQSIGDMAFDYQEGEFRPEKNPFNFKDFGINGEFNVTDYKGLIKDKDENFSFPKKVDSVVLDFTGKEGKFTGKLTVYNPHKYDNQEKKGITDKTQVNFNIITGFGELKRDFNFDTSQKESGNPNPGSEKEPVVPTGQEIPFVSSHRIEAAKGFYISEIKKDGEVVFENKDGDRAKTTWTNDVKFSGRLKGSAVVGEITEDDVDVTFPTVTYDVKFKRNLDVFILSSGAIDELKSSSRDLDNKPYNDYPTMLETDKNILSEIGKTTIEVYSIEPMQSKIFTGTLEDYLNFKHSNISIVNNIFKVTSVPKGFLLGKTLIHTIMGGDRQGSLYLATAREGSKIITSEADASKTNRWIKDETAPLGSETIKKVKVDKDFQYWDGIEWKNMFEVEGISKDSTDEYYTYIRSWGARKDVTSTKDHGTVYKADPEKPYGYENKVEGKDGTFKGYLIYPMGKLITGGILTIPQQPEDKVVVEHTPAIDTVITKGTKPETKIVERDGKKYEVTTTYTLNEKTGEVTPNVTEKEIVKITEPKINKPIQPGKKVTGKLDDSSIAKNTRIYMFERDNKIPPWDHFPRKDFLGGKVHEDGTFESDKPVRTVGKYIHILMEEDNKARIELIIQVQPALPDEITVRDPNGLTPDEKDAIEESVLKNNGLTDKTKKYIKSIEDDGTVILNGSLINFDKDITLKGSDFVKRVVLDAPTITQEKGIVTVTHDSKDSYIDRVIVNYTGVNGMSHNVTVLRKFNEFEFDSTQSEKDGIKLDKSTGELKISTKIIKDGSKLTAKVVDLFKNSSPVAEKNIVIPEYTVTVHAVDAVTGEKIKDIVKTYKEGTPLYDVDKDVRKDKIDGYQIEHGIMGPILGEVDKDKEQTYKYYKIHTLTFKFVNNYGEEVKPSKTFDCLGKSELTFVKKGDDYIDSKYPVSKTKADEDKWVFYGGNDHVIELSLDKDLYNGEFEKGSTLEWTDSDNTINVIVQKDEGTQTDLTGKDIEEMQNKIKELEGKVTELNDKITNLEKDNKDLLDKNTELKNELEKAKKEKTDLEDKIKELNDEITNQIGNIADQKAEIADLTKQVEDLNNKIKELEKKVSDLTTENQELKDKIAELEKKVKELEEKANQCSVDDSEKIVELEKVKKELADTKAELEKTKKALDDSKLSDAEKAKKIEELNKKISDLEKKVSDLTSENTELKNKVAGLEKKVSDLEKEVDKYKTSDAEKAKELEGIKTELEKTKSELEKAKEDLANSEKTIEEKNKKISELEKKVSDLEKKINDMKDKCVNKDFNEVEKKANDLDKKADEVTPNGEKDKAKLDEIKSGIEETKKDIEKAKEDAKAGKMSDAEKDKKIEDFNKKLTGLEKQLNELNGGNGSGNGSEGTTGGNNGNTGNNGGNGTTGHAVNSGNHSGIGMVGNAPSTGDENGMMMYLFSLILGGAVVVALRKKAERK